MTISAELRDNFLFDEECNESNDSEIHEHDSQSLLAIQEVEEEDGDETSIQYDKLFKSRHQQSI